MNHKYCMGQADVLASNGGRTMPYWALGRGTELGASYDALDPPYATWAIAQNPKAASKTVCVPNAQGPKAHCPNAQGCPEFNVSYYHYADEGPEAATAIYTHSLIHFDSRQRWWYQASTTLPPYSKFMTDINMCSSSGQPCLTATQPVHVFVPSVGSTVVTKAGRRGRVEGHQQTLTEMHAPVVRMEDTSAAEIVSRWNLSLACEDAATCAAAGVLDVDAQRLEPKLIGAFGSGFFLNKLSDIGSSFVAGKTGGVFIGDFTDEALLLTSGFPCPARTSAEPWGCFQRRVASGQFERVSAFDPYSGKVVSGVMQKLFNPVQDPLTGKWTSQEHRLMPPVLDETVTFGGSSYWVRFVRLQPLSDIRNLDWWVAVVVPHDDYLKGIEERQTVSLVVSLCAVVALLILLIGLTAVSFLRPITRLIGDFESACSMRLQDIETRTGGVVSEVDDLQTSFNKLVSNLWMYRPFLPPSCFGEGSEGETEEEDPSSRPSKTGSHGGQSARGSSSGENHKVVTLKEQLQCGLRRRKATVLATNVAGFSKLALLSDPAELVARHAAFVALMLNAAAPKGVAESFSGDRMVFSWNAVVSEGTGDAAFAAALRMSDLSFERCALHIGMSHGEALCGTMGPGIMKKYSIIAPCYGTSLLLLILNKAYDAPVGFENRHILMDNETCKKAESNFFLLAFVDVLAIPKLRAKRVRVWRLVGTRTVQEEEWMYQVADDTEGADGEWRAYLSGATERQYTVPRILDLLKRGVQGTEYVGLDPSVLAIMG